MSYLPPRVRQPGGLRHTPCTSNCDCTVCDSVGYPSALILTFAGLTGCLAGLNGSYTLPFSGASIDGGGNQYCLYHGGSDYEACGSSAIQIVAYIEDVAGVPSLEVSIQDGNSPYGDLDWQGTLPGTVGTVKCNVLSLTLDSSNLSYLAGALTEFGDQSGATVHVAASGDAHHATPCCCGGKQNPPNAKKCFIGCFSCDDPSCPLCGTSLYLCADDSDDNKWTGSTDLDNGGSVQATLTLSGDNWSLSWQCKDASGNNLGGGGSIDLTATNNGGLTLTGNGSPECGCTSADDLKITLVNWPTQPNGVPLPIPCATPPGGGGPGAQCGCPPGQRLPQTLLVRLPDFVPKPGVDNVAATLYCPATTFANYGCYDDYCPQVGGTYAVDFVGSSGTACSTDPPCGGCSYYARVPIGACAATIGCCPLDGKWHDDCCDPACPWEVVINLTVCCDGSMLLQASTGGRTCYDDGYCPSWGPCAGSWTSAGTAFVWRFAGAVLDCAPQGENAEYALTFESVGLSGCTFATGGNTAYVEIPAA